LDNHKINIAMFSGGRGTESLTQAFVSHPQIDLFLLVNAYDDGLSTGRLRRFIPGLLGPSDFRKNIAHLIPVTVESGRAIKRLLEYRLPEKLEFEKAHHILSNLYDPDANRNNLELDLQFWKDLENVSYQQGRYIETQVFSFLTYCLHEAKNGRVFEFGDCSFGNLLFAGAFLRLESDFNRTIADLERVFKPSGRVVNVTQGENYILVGLKSDGTLLRNEAEIVSPQNPQVLEEIYLLENYLTDNEIQKFNDLEYLESKNSFLKNKTRKPIISVEAKSVLENADLIIFGPGTQHSSLFPSYLSEGVGETIAENENAEKVFLANLRKDYEIQSETISTLCSKLHYYLNRKGEINNHPESYVTRYFFQDPTGLQKKGKNSLELELDNFSFPSRQTIITDWESHLGTHSGKRVLDELIAIVNERANISLKSFSYMVSIVVPVLNEERTLEIVLTKLNLLNLQPHGLSKEIIVVDGGSQDGSLEILNNMSYIRYFNLPKDSYGRGAALRYGSRQARGNIVVFFPSDDEYEPENIIDLVKFLQKDEFEAVFGSRSIKCLNLDDRIKTIYRGNTISFLLSKYGGLLLSMLCLLLFNRYVTDPLTGLKAFDRRLLKKLDLESDGVELETEIIAKLSKNNKYLLEVPVDYRPRLKSEGKKITVLDGFKAIIKLLNIRFLQK